MTSVTLAGLALAALLSENFILVTCMGIGTRRSAFQDPTEARRTGLALTLVMVLSTLLAWPVHQLLVYGVRMEYLQLLCFSLIVPGCAWLLRRLLALFLPELHRRLSGGLRAAGTNCAALGCLLLMAQRGYGLSQALTYALFGGLGAMLALMSFAGLAQEVPFHACPRPFRGAPIQLITAGLMALALVGYYGLNLGRI